MAVTANKQGAGEAGETGDPAPPSVMEVDKTAPVSGAEAGMSPAKDLQDRLSAYFPPGGRKIPARIIALLVMFMYLAIWLGGAGLYASLHAAEGWSWHTGAVMY